MEIEDVQAESDGEQVAVIDPEMAQLAANLDWASTVEGRLHIESATGETAPMDGIRHREILHVPPTKVRKIETSKIISVEERA